MTNDLTLDSLQRRMRAMHSLYYQAVDSMDIDHVNHFEREGVLPIAFCLFHITNMIDASFIVMTGATPIWTDEWAARVRMSINDHGKHRTVDEMVLQRIGDHDGSRRISARSSTARRRGSTASRCAMRPSAGSISTACDTWARSSSPAASSASVG